MSKKGYLKKHAFLGCHRSWVITEEGKDVLDEIDERLYDSPLHVESCNEHDYQVESVEQAEKLSESMTFVLQTDISLM